MKNAIAVFGVLVVSGLSLMAYVRFDFPGWTLLEQKSKDIVVVRCTETPDPYRRNKDEAVRDLRGLIESQMEVVSVLKGTTNSGAVHLRSEYWPRQGEYYLILANYSEGVYQAFESYRVVPLGVRFSPGVLTGKNFDQQVELLLRHRLNDLNRQLNEAQEEKERLEKKFEN